MTRHNMGYVVVQSCARLLGCSLREDRRFSAYVGKKEIENRVVHFLLPLTFMNLSGSAVRRYVDYFKIPVSGVIVVSDDVALPFGQLRLREGGSAGGHNGLKSVEAHLMTSHYKRLRMGIGHPGEQLMANYVLERFSHTEQQELPTFIQHGVEVLQKVLQDSFSNVMNQFNLTKPPIAG